MFRLVCVCVCMCVCVGALLSYMGCMHILEIISLSVSLFANIFSYSKAWLFVFFMVSFAVQRI